MRKITRIHQLYCVPEKKDENGRITKPAREGLLPFGRSYTYANLIHHSDDDPYVPGTKVRRLKLLHLSATAKAVFDDEVDELVEGLRQHRDQQLAT
jgi:hypothetical protein